MIRVLTSSGAKTMARKPLYPNTAEASMVPPSDGGMVHLIGSNRCQRRAVAAQSLCLFMWLLSAAPRLTSVGHVSTRSVQGLRPASQCRIELLRLRGGADASPAPMVHALSPCVALASDEPLALGGGQHSEDLGEGDSYSSDSADAEWLYRDALAQQPGDAIALGALADVLYRKGNVEGAVRCFESALASNPSSRSTLLSYGLLLLGRSGEGDADKAAELLGRAVQVDPTCVPALYMYGRLLHAVCGRLADAEDMYRQALSFEPARGDILNDYGALLEAQGGADDVVRGMYKRAAMLAPDNADALSNHARVLEEAGGGSDSKDDSAPAAVALYRRALDARPQHVPTLCNLAQTLAAMRGRVTPEAKDLMQRALALEPRDVGALCQYARFLQEEAAATGGDVDAEGEAAALGLYHDALALDPQRIEALNGIGTVLVCPCASLHGLNAHQLNGDAARPAASTPVAPPSCSLCSRHTNSCNTCQLCPQAQCTRDERSKP